MNTSSPFFLLYGLLLFISCSQGEDFSGETADFGTASYYKPFLFVKSDTAVLTKNMLYEFNDFAAEKKSFAKIQVMDQNQELIRNNNIRFFIDGKPLQNNEFLVTSNKGPKGKLKIGIQMLPGYPEGYTSGFLAISDHALDVVNSVDLTQSSEVRIFKWEATHRVVMNPLLKAILMFLALIVFILTIWFLFVRNNVYPKFKRGKIQILSPYFGGVSFDSKVRQIVFTAVPKRQKILNIIFTGEVKYHVNPLYTQDIIFLPGKANMIKIKMPVNVTINPPANNLQKFSSYTLLIDDNKIKIQYS